MPLRPVDVNEMGAVDSRSNPLVMPANRRLKLTNWTVNRAGYLQLRDGYTPVPMLVPAPFTPLATDNFDRPALGPNWTVYGSSALPVLAANHAVAGGRNSNATYNPLSPGADQYARIKWLGVDTPGAYSLAALMLRVSNGDASWLFELDTDGFWTLSDNHGAFVANTDLAGQTYVPLVANEVLVATAIGSVISLYRGANGDQLLWSGDVGAVRPTNGTSDAGNCGFGVGTHGIVDDFEVGNAVASDSPIHSLCPFRRLEADTRYVLFMQGTTPKQFNLATGEVTVVPTDTPFTSAARLSYYPANNRIHAVNGSDAKFYDGTKWRDIGLPALTEADVASVLVTYGNRELTAAEAAAVTITLAAGGTFPADQVGRSFYCAFFDTVEHELGPSTIRVGPGVKFTLNQKATLANLPDVSGENPNVVKLVGVTGDGRSTAYFLQRFTKAITDVTRTAPDTLTFHVVGHGLSAVDCILVSGTDNDANHRIWSVLAVSDADHFTVKTTAGGASIGGTLSKLCMAMPTDTSIEITSPEVDAAWVANQDRGLPGSTVGGTQPGYQFWAALYNPTTGHVGNRIKVGERYFTAHRSVVRVYNLPAVANPEWRVLLGRTGDGAEVPYVIADNLLNWHDAAGSTDSVTEAKIDGSAELPTRNGMLPAKAKAVAQVGDRIYVIVQGASYLYRSEDLAGSRARGGTFVGCPEQSFAATAEMFPTADEPTGVAEYNHEAWFGTRHDLAILSDLAGVLGWQGPWNVGLAGQNAFAKGWKSLPFWITGEKQLATMTAEGPVPVSDEYEAALLAKIGDAYLGDTEVVYYRDVALQKDELRIQARDATGHPFTVIHDFTLRDAQSPYGQAYDAEFQGPLGTPFTQAIVRDSHGATRVFAGAANGRLYQLYAGADDAGEPYTADCLALLYLGPQRNTVKAIEWFGDENLKIYFARELDTADFARFTSLTDPVPAQCLGGEAGNAHYAVNLNECEMYHGYLWLKLTSHGGSLNLNPTPHWPLETYGRVLLLTPLLGTPRGK